MKKFLMLCFTFGISMQIHAQTITIKDQESLELIEFATLLSLDPNVFATTNSNGQADISAFKDAEKIEIRSLGYKTVVKNYAELKSANFELLLEPFILHLDEVVVSATRWRQTTGNVPSKIVLISPKEIALQNPQTAADMLSLSGKVYIQKSQQGGGSPMIRGFATNRLLYSIDGIRLNNAIFRGGNIQNVINLDPFTLENTEVLFGPGSLIYGSDAIGGVMSFQTLTPQLSLNNSPLITGKAVTRYASANNEKTGHFDVNIGWEKWALLTSMSYWNYDHLRQGSHGPDDYIKPYYVQRQDSIDRVITQDDVLLQIPSAYSQINLMQKVRFKPNENWDFQYSFHFSETSPYGRYDRHNRIKEGTARYAEWNYGPQSWMLNNLTITNSHENALYDQLTLRLAHQAFEESRIDRSLNKDDRSTQVEDVKAYSANLDFVKTIGLRHTVFYGVEYVLNDIHSTGQVLNISTGIETEGPARYPQSTWSSMAVYVSDEFKASDNLTLVGGLRFNQFMLNAEFDTRFYPFPFTTASINNGALTGSIGAVFRPTDNWVIRTNLGTAFRSPNVDDMGKVFDSEPGTVTVPNPDLEAEYAYNVDLGIAKVFNDVVKLDVTGYYTLLQNALVRRAFTLNGQDSIFYDGELSQVQAIQNAAVARVYGVQAGVEVKLPAGFSFTSDLNYQVGEEELDDGTTSPARHAAPMFGVSRLSYSANKLSLQFYAMYQAERLYEDLPLEEQGKTEIYAKDVNGNPYAPAWYTLNLKVMYHLSEDLSASAGIENLTDIRYRPYSSGISAPGRSFIFSVRAKFQ
ncbi:MAG: TonB-dependent receptor [Saprospiraceae bacterium]|nr:TonB-dependent receptor [Saprospiraceae bacterium]